MKRVFGNNVEIGFGTDVGGRSSTEIRVSAMGQKIKAGKVSSPTNMIKMEPVGVGDRYVATKSPLGKNTPMVMEQMWKPESVQSGIASTGYKPTKAEAISYIKSRYPAQESIWNDYMTDTQMIRPSNLGGKRIRVGKDYPEYTYKVKTTDVTIPKTEVVEIQPTYKKLPPLWSPEAWNPAELYGIGGSGSGYGEGGGGGGEAISRSTVGGAIPKSKPTPTTQTITTFRTSPVDSLVRTPISRTSSHSTARSRPLSLANSISKSFAKTASASASKPKYKSIANYNVMDYDSSVFAGTETVFGSRAIAAAGSHSRSQGMTNFGAIPTEMSGSRTTPSGISLSREFSGSRAVSLPRSESRALSESIARSMGVSKASTLSSGLSRGEAMARGMAFSRGASTELSFARTGGSTRMVSREGATTRTDSLVGASSNFDITTTRTVTPRRSIIEEPRYDPRYRIIEEPRPAPREMPREFIPPIIPGLPFSFGGGGSTSSPSLQKSFYGRREVIALRSQLWR
jgi:hypothetical protein